MTTSCLHGPPLKMYADGDDLLSLGPKSRNCHSVTFLLSLNMYGRSYFRTSHILTCRSHFRTSHILYILIYRYTFILFKKSNVFYKIHTSRTFFISTRPKCGELGEMVKEGYCVLHSLTDLFYRWTVT